MSQEQQEQVLQNSEPQAVDVTFNVGGDSRAERFLGTFDQISRLSLDIDRNYGNKRVLTDFPLVNDGSKWTGTINKLIVGFDYTITGHAYKENSKIYVKNLSTGIEGELIDFPVLDGLSHWNLEIRFKQDEASTDWKAILGSMHSDSNSDNQGWGVFVNNVQQIVWIGDDPRFQFDDFLIEVGQSYKLNIIRNVNTFTFILNNFTTGNRLEKSINYNDYAIATKHTVVSNGMWTGTGITSEEFPGVIDYLSVSENILVDTDNSSYTEIFRGSTQHTVTEGTNSLNLRLSPLLDDRELTVPRITRIERPFQMTAGDNESIKVTVDSVKESGSSAQDGILSYRFRSVDNESMPLGITAGGSFTPDTGEISNPGSGYPRIITSYKAPDNASTQRLQVRVSNELEIGVDSFVTVYVTDNTSTQSTVDSNPVVSNLSAERIGEDELLWTLHVSDDEDFNNLDVKWEYLFGEDRNLDNQTKTKLTFNTGRLDAVMKGYQDTDDGMLLVTVCENDVPGYSSCNYMNEGSTSIQFELIPHAFSIPIICDGNFCQNDGDLDDDGVKDEYDADPNDPNKSTIYPLALRDNASDNSSPMSGLALWLDASNIDGNNNTSLSDGDAVSEWKDLSGNDIDIDKNDSGNLPKLINEQNKNFVAFNQNGDNNEHLYSSKTFEGLKNQNKFSLYIVQKLDSLAETDMDTISIIYGNADIIAFENNSWVEGGYRFQTCIPGICSDVRSGNGNTNINLITLQKDSSNLKILVNGQLQDNHNEVFENTDTSTADLKIILSGLKFNNGGLNDRNLIGRIGEIIIIAGEVSNENNLKINNYLSNKWNLTSTVDSDDDGIVDASDPFPTDPSKWINFPQALRDNASDNFTAMDGLVLWLDATNIDGEMNSSLSDGDAVSEWKDLSGNGNDVVQANNSFSPTLNKVSEIGGNPGIEFSSDFLTLSSSNSFDNWSKYTKIVVYETNQVSTAQVIIDIHWKNSSDIDVGANEIGINSGHSYFNARNINRIASQAKFDNLQMNTPYIALAEDLDNNGSHLFHNGEEGSIKGSIADAELKSFEHLRLGAYQENFYLDGTISEVLVFNKELIPNEKILIYNYLSSKWNLTSTVDSDGDGLMDAEDSEPTVKNCANDNFMAFSEISSPSNTSNVGNLSCAANSGISSQGRACDGNISSTWVSDSDGNGSLPTADLEMEYSFDSEQTFDVVGVYVNDSGYLSTIRDVNFQFYDQCDNSWKTLGTFTVKKQQGWQYFSGFELTSDRFRFDIESNYNYGHTVLFETRFIKN